MTQAGPTEPRLRLQVDASACDAIRRRRAELGDAFPRIGLFLFDCADPKRLRSTLSRVPEALDACLDQVVVVPPRDEIPSVAGLAGGRSLDLRVHRTPGEGSYGGLRKGAFEYAIRAGLDLVIAMRGDGLHPPEALPQVLGPALEDPDRLVVASRLVRRVETYRAGMPLLRLAAHLVATGFANQILGIRLHDYYSTFRLYPVRALASIPFQLDADDRAFETQIAIQFRALGTPIHEASVLPVWREYGSGREAFREVLRSVAQAVDYRLHQLHLTRRGPYLVDQSVHYTLKRSPTGSHMQIVAAIPPDSEVLDLGCSQGLLARPLLEKNARVTGVDTGPGERLARELEAYYPRDLEWPLELPVERIFDRVVVSDVIEHIRARTQLLRSVRRYLKEDGRLIISTPNIALWFYRLSLLVGRFEYGPRGVLDETHVHLYTGATFRREVERAGFRVVAQRVTGLPFEVVFQSTGRSRLLRAVDRSYHALARLWPALFAYQFILEAEIITLDEESTTPPS